ncbi:citrate lyase subunit alpha [Mycoplasmatota bacterium]|nr:citrate lyase subunit alpha [Mycoplasmatota bacterium]
MYKEVRKEKNEEVLKPSKNNQSKEKYRRNLQGLLDELEIKDGMTLSFHHHLRNGDYVLNMVMEEIVKRGVKDITIFASSIFPCHSPLVDYIEKGIVTQIIAAFISGPVAEAISQGKMKKVAIMHTHGGRVRLVESGDVSIDIAFIAAPTCDEIGNLTGNDGISACGSMGYAVTDAHFAKTTVVITDNLIDKLDDIEVEGKYIDYIVKVDSIGDCKGIVSGTTQITKNPIGLKIARLTTDVIHHSGYFKNGFSFQTGAGGTSLAVSYYLKQLMIKENIKGSFASGGITGYIVDMLEARLFDKLYDVQCFDLEAIRSIRENENHIPISASKYANINDDCIVNDLDFVILGATEIDLNFNVNVTTSSTGEIMGGSGGHSDTANGAKVAIIVSQLFNSRIPVIKDKVICKTTPGETIDVLVTERGIAVNPRRKDLIERFKKTNLPLKTIEELKAISDSLVGIPNQIHFTDKVVGVVEYRDGSVIDFLYQKQ